MIAQLWQGRLLSFCRRVASFSAFCFVTFRPAIPSKTTHRNKLPRRFASEHVVKQLVKHVVEHGAFQILFRHTRSSERCSHDFGPPLFRRHHPGPKTRHLSRSLLEGRPERSCKRWLRHPWDGAFLNAQVIFQYAQVEPARVGEWRRGLREGG